MEIYDFPVELQKVYDQYGTPIPYSRVITRTDIKKPLSIVSDRYSLFTHKEAVDVTGNFLKSFGDYATKNTVERNGLRFVRECNFQTHALKLRVPKVDEVVKLRLSVVNSYDCKSSLQIKIGAMVLRCLNGMTAPGGELCFSFRHTESIRDLTLPAPEEVLSIFEKAGETWNEWAGEKLVSAQRDSIIEHALNEKVIGERLLDKYRTELEPDITNDVTFWDYFNNFTHIITHNMARVQLTNKFVRLDKLNKIFDRVLHGTPQEGFSDEEME